MGEWNGQGNALKSFVINCLQKASFQITGCLPKCTINRYKFQDRADGQKDVFEMRKDWISSFYLSTRTTTNHTSVETYSYDEQAESINYTKYKISYLII